MRGFYLTSSERIKAQSLDYNKNKAAKLQAWLKKMQRKMNSLWEKAREMVWLMEVGGRGLF